MAAPAFDASGDSVATIPVCEITIERAWPRSCADAICVLVCAIEIADMTINPKWI